MNQKAKAVLLAILRAYKWALSPMFPPACRYVPTCSEYAAEAVERYCAVRGSAMALWRLLRCHPFAQGGFDPVPIKTVWRGPALSEVERGPRPRNCWQDPHGAETLIHSGCSHMAATPTKSHA